MQNAKDTFYEVLRGRLAAVNPARTVVLRGVTRPGLLVEENEGLSAAVVPDCFRLRWAKVDVASDGALPLVTLTCEVVYETSGSALSSGLDRGRSLATMDAELIAAVTTISMRAPKMSYAALASGGAVTSAGSAIWWGAPVLRAAEVKGDRLRRTAWIEVMALQEAGEM